MATNSNQINTKVYRGFVTDVNGTPTGIAAISAANVSNVPAANLVGNLSNVSLTGSNTFLGGNANVRITGGNNSQALSTDGTGNLRWSTLQANTTPSGSNTQVQYNNSENLGGISTATWDGSKLSLGSNANIRITGGSNGQALLTSGGGNMYWDNPTIRNTIVNGNSNVFTTVDGNVGTSVAGVANVFVVTGSGANIRGTLNATGAATLGGNLSVAGNTNVGVRLNLSGSAVFTGNVSITGTSNTVAVANLDISNPIIDIGGGANGANLANNDGRDRGLVFNYFKIPPGPLKGFVGWDTSNNEFAISGNTAVANEVVTFNSLANVRADIYYGNAVYGVLTSNGVATLAQVGANGNVIINRLTVNDTANLGSNANIRITGGSRSDLLLTDGAGNLYWGTATTARSTKKQQPAIEFTGSITGSNNQTFTNANLNNFTSGNYAMVFVNGIQQSTSNYSLGGTTLCFNIPLPASANIAVSPLIGLTGGNSGIRDSILSGSSNVLIASANGVVSTSVGGVANVFVVDVDGANVAGNVVATGNLYLTPEVVVNGDANIGGDFTITGNIAYDPQPNLVQSEPILELGGIVGGAPLTLNDNRDRGTLLHNYTTQPVDTFMGWDNAAGEFIVGSNVSVSTGGIVAATSLANTRADTWIGNTVATSLTTSDTATLANIVGEGNANLTTMNVGGVTTLGDIGNVRITGGVANSDIRTDGTGNLRYYKPPTVQIPYVSVGWGRFHVHGSRIWRAGGGSNGIGGSVFNQQGSLNNANNAQSSIETPIENGEVRNWVKTANTNYNFYALDDQGVLWTMGDPTNGVLGNNATTGYRDFLQIANSPKLYGPGITVLDFWITEFMMVDGESRGRNTVLVHVNDNGTLKTYGFGYNRGGAVGNGTQTPVVDPYLITQLDNKSIVDVSLTATLSFVVTSTGEVWGVGWNFTGPLGTGTFSPVGQQYVLTYARATRSDTTLIDDAVRVVGQYLEPSGAWSAILTTSGTVWACGWNDSGRLGIGNTTNVARFTQVRISVSTFLTDVIKIGVSPGGLILLRSNGELYFTGPNNRGIWGDGSASGTAGNNYAAVKQTNVGDFWCPVIHYVLNFLWTLDKDVLPSGHRRLWGNGDNRSWILGIDSPTGNSTEIVLQRRYAPLPGGEWPVQVNSLGGYTAGGTPVFASILVTNRGNLYVASSNSVNGNGLLFGELAQNFKRIVDFFNPNDL